MDVGHFARVGGKAAAVTPENQKAREARKSQRETREKPVVLILTS